MTKKGCIFRNDEYLITVLEDPYSTCFCLPLKSLTFTHMAAKPELKCNSSSVICYFQLVSQKVFVSVATNIGQCVHTKQLFRFQGWGIRVWIFFLSDSESSIAHHHSFLPLVEAIFIRILWFAHRCECESIWLSVPAVSVDRNSRVNSDVHVLTWAKSC